MADCKYDEDSARFEMMAKHLRAIAETMLKEFFGHQCYPFEEGCIVCQRWKALDDLTENPFDELKPNQKE